MWFILLTDILAASSLALLSVLMAIVIGTIGDDRAPFWAFVWRVFKDRAALNEELGYEEYETKTRGVRRISPARRGAQSSGSGG
jgi:hypothetical protein